MHHTAGRQPAAADVPDELRSIYRFHTGPARGWPDVCYNFFVDPQGGVWEGRAGSLAGPVEASATGGSQGFAQLVCLLGDFTAVMPSDAALDSLTRTLAWLAQRDGIDTRPDATVSFASRGSNRWPAGTMVTAATISGHRDMSATACPGNTFYPFVTTTLRERVRATVTAANTSTTSTPSTIVVTRAPGTTVPTTTVRETSTSSAAPVTTSTIAAPHTTTPSASASTANTASPGHSSRIGSFAGSLGAGCALTLGALGFVIARRRDNGIRAPEQEA